MEAVESYRPGNLIIGGGGRGVKVAPKELGIGEWEILKNHGGKTDLFFYLSFRYQVDTRTDLNGYRCGRGSSCEEANERHQWGEEVTSGKTLREKYIRVSDVFFPRV